ncbi:hypothetical protein [Chromobacterium sp. Panama]|uniref:hypothetical protein n=1 Tax=Chromobacterium sp. Panama TaxID=2161826 RepID=UPI0011B1E3FB|nr:hypothetical protein [Chromobacterium sp. Panama]
MPNVNAHWRPRPPKGCVPWGSTHPTRYCTAGQPLPLLDVAFPLPWWQQWLSKEWKVYRATEVEWELVRYQNRQASTLDRLRAGRKNARLAGRFASIQTKALSSPAPSLP